MSEQTCACPCGKASHVVTRSARPHLPLCTCARCKAERPVNP